MDWAVFVPPKAPRIGKNAQAILCLERRVRKIYGKGPVQHPKACSWASIRKRIKATCRSHFGDLVLETIGFGAELHSEFVRSADSAGPD